MKDIAWKDVIGYEGVYKVSNKGEIYSVKYDKVLKKSNNGRGYHVVCLMKDGVRNTQMVHRLVAFAFIPNNDINKTEINHINEVKTDNRLENLEWCTRKENNNYGNRSKKQAQKLMRKVDKLDLDGNYIATYSSMKEAGILCGICKYKISANCRGKNKYAGGFKWRYSENT